MPKEPGPCRFLTVEDFGTTSLDGDPAELPPPAGRTNRFFAFFRAEGVSHKGGKDGGRWGVGKTVFLRSSDINTILGYHWIGTKYFTPDGTFGVRSKDGVQPSEEPELVSRFHRDVGLVRGDEPGLSVVVPYIGPDLTGAAIVASVMREYFHPILSDV